MTNEIVSLIDMIISFLLTIRINDKLDYLASAFIILLVYKRRQQPRITISLPA
jgi:hypothetical protein